MSKAIRIHEYRRPRGAALGGRGRRFARAGPGRGCGRRRSALNYIDIYHRTGLYPLPSLPAVIGMEAAGVVEEVGEGVTDVHPGQRVAYASPPPGAYAEERLMPADRLVALAGRHRRQAGGGDDAAGA